MWRRLLSGSGYDWRRTWAGMSDDELLRVARTAIEHLRRRGWDIQLRKIDQSGELTISRTETR